MSTVNHKTPVGGCSELSTGDPVEARYQGQLAHAGKVTETAAQLGVFWILDEVSGGRKLLDVTDFEIFRLSPSAPRRR